MLDSALIRPGRFDRIIYVGAPDFEGRIEVLKVGGSKHAPLILPLQSWNATDGQAACRCEGGVLVACMYFCLCVWLAARGFASQGPVLFAGSPPKKMKLCGSSMLDSLELQVTFPGNASLVLNRSVPPRQVHLAKTLPNGERRAYDISEEEFHELSFQFQRFSGAMLANIVNTAVILAGREGRTTIIYRHLTRVRCWSAPPQHCLPLLVLRAGQPMSSRDQSLSISSPLNGLMRESRLWRVDSSCFIMTHIFQDQPHQIVLRCVTPLQHCRRCNRSSASCEPL